MVVDGVLGLVDGVHLGQAQVGDTLVYTELASPLEQGFSWCLVNTVADQPEAFIMQNLQLSYVFFGHCWTCS